MITTAAIKVALNTLLNTKYNLKMYGMEVTEGYDKPSFFTDIRFNRASDETVNIVKKDFSFYITYFQKKIDEVDNLKKIDEIRELLTVDDERYKKKRKRMAVKVGDRYLKIDNYSSNYTGEKNNILQISFDINFYDFDAQEETETPINNISVDRKVVE